MSCPICGANCRCRKRGPDGMCCSCHKHKVKRLALDRSSISSQDERMLRSYDQHLEWMRCTFCHAPVGGKHSDVCPLAEKKTDVA